MIVYCSPEVIVMTTITRSVRVVPISVTVSPIRGLSRFCCSLTQSDRITLTFIRVTIPSPNPPSNATVIEGFSVMVLRLTVTLTASYAGIIWVGPGSSEQASRELAVGAIGGLVFDRVGTGAGIAGDD